MRQVRLLVILLLTTVSVAACSSAVANTSQGATNTAATSAAPSDGPSATLPGTQPTASKKASAKPRSSRTPTRAAATTGPVRPGVGVPGPAGSIRGTSDGTVALTFDDGPDPVNTPPLLAVLRKYGVKATFCLVGSRVEKHPEIVRQIAADGHTLCNHSWQHLENLAARDDSYLRWDLLSTNQRIQQAVPGATVRYFRNPYGNFTPRVNAFAAELQMKPIYWDVDDDSWKTSTYGKGQPMIDHIVAVLKSRTRAGSIVLSHDNLKPHTAVAYDAAIPWLKERFRLAPLPNG